MERVEKENIQVGTGIVTIFQRMPQKLERVFAEFIDNSIQSFFDHKEQLVKINKKGSCVVKILWNSQEIIIEDNAYGMSHEDFKHALRINSPQEHYSVNSRGQYGMGLKIAAAFLGNWYSIESTAYNSNEKYYSCFDIKQMKETNPETVDNIITECALTEHYTKITIKNLESKLINSVDKSLREKLASIYYDDLDSGELEIVLNGVPIVPKEPELRINPDTGMEYLTTFEDKFVFNKHEYSYNGWVGILKVGVADEAGFKLSQNGRGIILNYRPESWKKNSFEYQRIIGNINLDDIDWKISFNKDQFTWKDGLESAFVESLLQCKDITDMVSISRTLRKETPPVVIDDDIAKTRNIIENKFKKLETVQKTVVPDKKEDEEVSIKLEDEKKDNIINITWESINYSFEIRVVNNDTNDDWLKLQKKSDNNEYYIIINGLTSCFNKYKKNECKSMMFDFAISLVLSKLSSVRLGLDLDESDIFIKELNQVLKNIE